MMKKIICATILVALLMNGLMMPSRAAQDMLAIDEAGGPIQFELPDAQAIAADKQYDTYRICWEAMGDVYQYHIGVTLETETVEGATILLMSEGWLGDGKIKNGLGKEYPVEKVIFDAIEASGSANEVDIAPILNKFTIEAGSKLVGAYCIVLVVPTSGAPYRQIVELPVA